MKGSLFLISTAAVLISGLLPTSVCAEMVSSGMTYMPEAPGIAPMDSPPTDKRSPLGTFVMYVPWKTHDVTCDGYVDPATEWSDAAKYDISDTSGQHDSPDPPGTVDLYVKQDSIGVWFAVINHADTVFDDYDEIGLYFDENHDGCFPDTLTNEGNMWIFWLSDSAYAMWRWMQDHDCDPQSSQCVQDDWDAFIVSLPCCAMGLTNGRVSYETMIPYGLIDYKLQVPSVVGTEMGFFVFAQDIGSDNIHGEWPSQHRTSTWSEPCYYGDLICDGHWHFKPGYDDYAISGMPDFDQKQNEWHTPDTTKWTYCGPVAMANCLWWLDSKYQWLINPGSPRPPNVNDDFSLVQTWGGWDDHDTLNVIPLVDTLAWHMDTDGTRTGDGSLGTDVSEMQAAIAEWLLETETDTVFYAHTEKAPDFHWIEEEIERCEDVILLLGFWQYAGLKGWNRLGGHYVTCAGVNSQELTLAISDPYDDMAETGWPGRVRNGMLSSHAPIPGHEPRVHNDAGNASHDYYAVLKDSLSPGGPWSIADYPVYDDILYSLEGVNFPPEFQDLEAPYDPGQSVHTEIEYALAISPIREGWHLKGGYPDYAPDGMPDFDQNQHGWTGYCGPTAVANCLWWFDSKYQWLSDPGMPPPPYVYDTFDLVTSYITGDDDHSYEPDASEWDNVQYLIDELAGYMLTDPIWGTDIDDMQMGIEQWLLDRGVGDILYRHTLIDSTLDPQFFPIIVEEIECCQDVILLLGFWENVGAPTDTIWHRVGGHYVTCAGINSDSMLIMFSDPDYDQQIMDYPTDSKWHNNAALVSHDVYGVAPSPSLGGYWGLPDYPAHIVGIRHELENCPAHLKTYENTWMGGDLCTEIEAAVFISPLTKPASVDSLSIYTAFGTAGSGSKDIRLTWSPVTEDTAGCPAYPHYVLYRDTVPNFTPGPAKQLTTTTDTCYIDINAAGNSAVNYFYYVTARAGTVESANSRCVGEIDKYLPNMPPAQKDLKANHHIKHR